MTDDAVTYRVGDKVWYHPFAGPDRFAGVVDGAPTDENGVTVVPLRDLHPADHSWRQTRIVLAPLFLLQPRIEDDEVCLSHWPPCVRQHGRWVTPK